MIFSPQDYREKSSIKRTHTDKRWGCRDRHRGRVAEAAQLQPSLLLALASLLRRLDIRILQCGARTNHTYAALAALASENELLKQLLPRLS